jgi:hypothetical protein
MTRFMLSAAIVLALTIPSAAWCQSHGPGGCQAGDGPQFQQRAEILSHLGEWLAELQPEQSCVQVANNPAAPRACMRQAAQATETNNGGICRSPIWRSSATAGLSAGSHEF